MPSPSFPIINMTLHILTTAETNVLNRVLNFSPECRSRPIVSNVLRAKLLFDIKSMKWQGKVAIDIVQERETR